MRSGQESAGEWPLSVERKDSIIRDGDILIVPLHGESVPKPLGKAVVRRGNLKQWG